MPGELLFHRCLNAGFVALVDTFGTDESIVQAARVSYGKGTKGSSTDGALISYLLRQRHTSPFEMVEMKFLCRMPIFVARQWIRHRTANVNEYSGRYSEMKPYFYVPHLGSVAVQSATNKQGRDEDLEEMIDRVAKTIGGPDGLGSNEQTRVFWNALRTVDEEAPLPTQKLWDKRLCCLAHLPDELINARQAAASIQNINEIAWSSYQHLLEKGVAREMARVVLPLTMYTEWYWKMDLHNLLHFLRLRLDPHAQAEIRVYAEAIANFVQREFPLTYGVFEDMMAGCFLTGEERQVIVNQFESIQGTTIAMEDMEGLLDEKGFSKRRIGEFKDKMGL
jgi:thymidylate synthase (FAD)